MGIMLYLLTLFLGILIAYIIYSFVQGTKRYNHNQERFWVYEEFMQKREPMKFDSLEHAITYGKKKAKENNDIIIINDMGNWKELSFEQSLKWMDKYKRKRILYTVYPTGEVKKSLDTSPII